MAQKRKRSASRASGTKSKKKSNVGSATTNSYDKEEVHPIQKPTKRKGSQKVEHAVGETIEYDPVHKGSSRRARGKVTKVLTGAKKSDPTTSEVRYVIENENTGKETIYGQHSVKGTVE